MPPSNILKRLDLRQPQQPHRRLLLLLRQDPVHYRARAPRRTRGKGRNGIWVGGTPMRTGWSAGSARCEQPPFPPSGVEARVLTRRCRLRVRLRTAAATPSSRPAKTNLAPNRNSAPAAPKAGWTFSKKSQSFAFSVFRFLRYDPNIN
jgi:hypothetical protein